MRSVWVRIISLFASTALAGGVNLLPATAVAAPTTLTTCVEADFDNAVAAGGTILFGVDCTLGMTAAVTIGSGLTVDVEANGHTVILNGGLRTRHFVVSGGSLTLGNLVLRNGSVTATPGGTGIPGAIGATPSNGTGQNGGDGKPGQAGVAGADAQGGSILINSGQVTLNGVQLIGNSVTAGNGGNGGNGGQGGNGGSGSDGSLGNPGRPATPFTPETDGSSGGPGNPGGNGGNGADGGAGANGGAALGGPFTTRAACASAV